MRGSDSDIWQVFTFYKPKGFSFQKTEIEEDDVLVNVPITKVEYDACARLVFCYASGHVVVIDAKKFRLKKTAGHLYNLGLNDKAELRAVFVALPSDYLVVVVSDKESRNHIKAHAMTDFSDIKTLSAQGAMIANPNSTMPPADYFLVPVELKGAIRALIRVKSQTSTELGELCMNRREELDSCEAHTRQNWLEVR